MADPDLVDLLDLSPHEHRFGAMRPPVLRIKYAGLQSDKDDFLGFQFAGGHA
jgi:hypothetical protein